MSDCLFCQIVVGKIPSYKIYEDELHLAFLDIFPFGWGHTLLIPKDHHQWVWDIPEIGEYFEVAKKITQHYHQALNLKHSYYFTIGEMIPHAHLHILPATEQNANRYVKTISSLKQPQLDPKKAEKIQQQLRLS